MLLFLLFVCSVSRILIRLSIPVQVIDWKVEKLVSEMTCNVLMQTFNPAHSLTE